MSQEYFSVELSASIRLGLPLEDMTTVAQFERQNLCLVPGVAPFWYGVVNFKGSLLWVLDSDRFFHLPEREKHPTQKLTAVVLNHQIEGTQRRVAVVVKKLVGIMKVEPDRLKPLTTSLPSTLQNLSTAMVAGETHTTCILNFPAFMEQLYQQSALPVVA